MKLRYYQEEAVNKALEIKNGIIVCPTGAGKSIIIAELCRRLSGKILILQPTIEILQQNKQKIFSATSEKIGIYSASAGEKTISRITLATIQSIKDFDLFARFNMIVCDESHLVNAKGGGYEKLINFIKPEYLIGLTATPYRMAKNRFSGTEFRLIWRTKPKIFKQLIYAYQNTQILADGYWTKTRHFQYTYNEDGLTSGNRNDFTEESILRINKLNSIYEKIIAICKNTKKSRVLIFATKIEEAEFIAKITNGYAISSKSEDRDELLNKFSNGKIRVLVNVGILTTGYDLPALDCIVLARPTMSLSLYCQMVGRGLRICEGKNDLELHDLCGNIKRFGKVETMEIAENYLVSEKGNLIGFKPQNSKSYVMEFGRWRGRSIEEVDDGYIKWASKEFKNHLKEVFLNEARRRELI
jgi:DNA repair protein RadD